MLDYLQNEQRQWISGQLCWEYRADNSTEGRAIEVHSRCSQDINLHFGDICQASLIYPHFTTHQFIYLLNWITMESENTGMQR